MPVPLSLAVPAAAAGLAYLNARGSVFYDARLLHAIAPTAIRMLWRERNGTINRFYDLESLAKSSSSANRAFLLFEDKRYTYAEAYDLTLRYGNWLKTRWGVERGEIVALDFQNTDTFVFLWLGLWSIGAKPAFINYNLSGNALTHCVKKATTSLMFIDPVVAPNVGEDVQRELGKEVRFEVFGTEMETEARNTEPVRYPDELRFEPKNSGMAILIYTSGTTGLPKAAIVSWGKMFVSGTFSSLFIGCKSTDIYYTSMPLYHSTATLMSFSTVLGAGATLALGRKFSTRHYWHDIRKHHATIMQYVGETCRYLLAAPPSIDPSTGDNLDRAHRVRVAFGNGLRPDVWNQFKVRFGIDTIVEFYGATEGILATWNWSRNDFSMGAVGRAGWLYNLIMGRGVAFVEIDHETDTPARDSATGFCRRAAPGQPGELIFKLPEKDIEARFQGYYGDGAATAKKIMRGVFSKGDAWFRTGDVLRHDSEGRIYFTDRIGDTFRWKSENVSTAEVSQVVGLHPAVREANVYGVELPHHDGRAGCVAIVLDGSDGERTPSAETLRSLADHVRRGLPRFALPIFLRVLKETGVNTTGTNKQQKHIFRQQGISPSGTDGDQLFWLRDGTYVRFGHTEWDELNGGRVKL